MLVLNVFFIAYCFDVMILKSPAIHSSRSPGYYRRSSRDEYRPSSRGGRDSYDDRDRPVERFRGTERGYGRSEDKWD